MMDSTAVEWQGLLNIYERYSRPLVARHLASIGMDAVFHRAEGDYLWVRRNGQDVKILDLVGGFGANLFGHNHPEVVAEAHALLDARTPVLVQGSVRTGAALLAKELCRRLGDYVAILTNSGAETVEAAIKHLYLTRHRPVLWAVKGAFHGKTSAAVKLTWMHSDEFAELGPAVRFIDPDDPEDWETAREEAARTDSIGGAFVEVIQGEGGVRPLSAEFILWLGQTCRTLGIPIVADEIQTGFGRTGTFLASAAVDLDPDYVCLSKALGGGLGKIGALLIRRKLFNDEFSLSHTSTFAEDDWSSRLALKALQIIDRDDLIERCRLRGNELIDALKTVQQEFPGIIKEVRGRGLMVGVELAPQLDSPSITLRAISQQGHLGWVASSYLLNVHDIRIAPTISRPSTLRIEPSAYITSADICQFVNALHVLCTALEAGDSGHLFDFLVGRPTEPVRKSGFSFPFTVETARTHRRVGFIVCFGDADQLGVLDPSLGRFSGGELESFIQRTSVFLKPALLDQVHVRSLSGDEVHLSVIGIDRTAGQMARLRAGDDLTHVVQDVDRAVSLARDEGCLAVGLGGYTSSVTSNCLRIQTKGVALTSGNALSVGMGIRALRQAASHLNILLSRSWVGVVGVPGNIATTAATILASDAYGLVLIARSLTSAKFREFVNSLRLQYPHKPIEVSDSPSALGKCALVFTATVGVPGLIQPIHLGHGPIAICEMSMPSDVDVSVTTQRPEVLVIRGGTVRLKGNDELAIAGLGLPPGHVFACLAETLLMGLEEMTSHGSYGAISPGQVERMIALADKHGFALADIDYNGTAIGDIDRHDD